MRINRLLRLLLWLAELGEAYIHPRRGLRRYRARHENRRIAQMSQEEFEQWVRDSGIHTHLVDVYRLMRKKEG